MTVIILRVLCQVKICCFVVKMASDRVKDFSRWMTQHFESVVAPEIVLKGKQSKKWLDDYFSKQENRKLQQLIEHVEHHSKDVVLQKVLYPESVMECAKCHAIAKNLTFNDIGKVCNLCSGVKFRRFLSVPKMDINFHDQNFKTDPIIELPYEFIFVVGRHTNGKTMDTGHRYRAEVMYYR